MTHLSSGAMYRTKSVPGNLQEVNFEGKNFTGAESYARSKLCNVLLSNKIARKMKKENILILSNSLMPGLVRTEMAYTLSEELKTLGTVGPMIFDYVLHNVAWDTEEGTLAQLYVTVGDEIIREKISGEFFHPIAIKMKQPDTVTVENEEKLWKLGLELLKRQNMLRK